MTTGNAIPIEDLSYNLDRAGAILSVSRRTLYELINSGELATFKVGRRRLVSRRELERFVSEREGAS